MFLSKRSTKEEILKKIATEKARQEAKLDIARKIASAAAEFNRKNLDRNFVTHAQKYLPERVYVSMSGSPFENSPQKNITIGGGSLGYHESITLYSIKDVAHLKEEAAKTPGRIEETITSLSTDEQHVDAILEAHDKAEKAIRDLEALPVAAWAYRDALPVLALR